MTRIVALYSYMCESGKDTCADMIAEWCRMETRSFSRAAFADEMKLVCADALGYGPKMPREHKIHAIDELKMSGYVRSFHPDNSALAVTHNNGRDFIIGLAESIRRLDREFWIRHTAASEAEIHAITDMRFQPEVDWVRANNGIVVEVVRPGAPHKNEDHIPSDQIDYTINNDGSLEDLGLSVFAMMDYFFPA